MELKEEVYYCDENQIDMDILRAFLKEHFDEYSYEQVSVADGISKATFTAEGTKTKIEYVISGMRRKLTSLGYT